jgi:hypothetical protein
LTNLDSRGDLRHNVDYRRVFATLLSSWLHADDQQVFGQSFAKLDMFEVGTSCAAGLVDNIPVRQRVQRGSPSAHPRHACRQRRGEGTVGARGGVLELVVAGRGTVPASGIGAVVMKHDRFRPDGRGIPDRVADGRCPSCGFRTSNFVPGQAVPNLVLAKLGQGGKVSIFNFTGSTNVIADVMGWFPMTNSYQPLVPQRLLDTRTGLGAPQRARRCQPDAETPRARSRWCFPPRVSMRS